MRDRCTAIKRRRRKKINREVAIGHRVDAVLGDAAKAQLARDHAPIDRQGRAGQRARPERHHGGALERLLEPLAIAPEHLDIGQHVMGERYRLRALQMRIAGHHGLDVGARDLDQRAAQSAHERDHCADFVAQIEPQIERDLIVARSRGMQFAARGPDFFDQPALDREMDILVGDVEAKMPGTDLALDSAETRSDLARFRRGDQANLREHLRVRDRTENIVAVEPPIERQRRAEGFDLGQPRNLEASANEILAAIGGGHSWRGFLGRRRFGASAGFDFATPLHR